VLALLDGHLAEIAMNAMPPIPFHEFVTKADLHAGLGELRGELKADIGEVRAEMGELRGEMGELRGEMGELRGELRGEMGKLRGDLQSAMATQFRILVGAQLATLVAVVSLIPILS